MRDAIAYIAASDLLRPLKLIVIMPAGIRLMTFSSEAYFITNSEWTKSISINFSNDGENKKLAELSPLRIIG